MSSHYCCDECWYAGNNTEPTRTELSAKCCACGTPTNGIMVSAPDSIMPCQGQH